MSSTSLTVLVPLSRRSPDVRATVSQIEQYLSTTGFEFRVITVEHGVRRAAAEATDSIVVVVDPDLPYNVGAIGDAVALIQSGAADVVFGSRPNRTAGFLLRSLLVNELPDPALQLKALSPDAARLLFSEAKLDESRTDLEIAYLANKYGFRIEHLFVQPGPVAPSVGLLGAIAAAVAIRLTDRRNGYRAPRRCPVCFSSEVWTCAQIPNNVVRACGRCKCRYLDRIIEPQEGLPVHRELRAHPIASDSSADPFDETARTRNAKERTNQRRIKLLRSQVPSHGRLLEIGVRDGSFGVTAAREYEYVGIDRAAAAARAARARGLEVYCATLLGFVNTGPAFDAVTLYHVFESMTDPHDALARIKDLLKPGGVLMLTALDTEALPYLMSERKRAAQNFRTRAILYSRSALIELLERSGFEISSVAPDFEYRDHKFLRHRLASRSAAFARLGRLFLKLAPDPLLVSSGSIRILAKRRAGAPLNLRAIRSVEPTHAR